MSKKRLPLVISILAFFAFFAWGHSRLGMIETDGHSEGQVLTDLHALFAGKTRAGISEYTHYPNGPTYLLVPFSYWGVSDEQLRLIPITLLALAFSFFLFQLIGLLQTYEEKGLALLGVIALYLQPEIVNWAGALHQQSYVMTLLVLLAGLAFRDRAQGKLLFFIGFSAGWIGYDFIPAQIFTYLTIRTLAKVQWQTKVSTAFKETSTLAGGVLTAVFLHFVQNIIYFRNFDRAYRDLFGSLAARIDTQGELAKSLNPGYQDWLQSAETHHPLLHASRMDLLTDLLKNTFSTSLTATLFLLAITSLLILGFVRKRPAHAPGLMSVTILGALFATCTWTVLMKHHAIHHAWTSRVVYSIWVILLSLAALLPITPKGKTDALPT